MRRLFITCFLIIIRTSPGIILFYNSEDIINKVNTGNNLWKAGHNFGANVTLSYIKGLLGVKNMTSEFATKVEHDLLVPEEFDAREHWPYCPSVGQIRDQGNCGACWAVAAGSVFTDRLCIATRGNVRLPLSDQELLSCGMKTDGCDGGSYQVGWEYIRTHGLVTGGGYASAIGCQPYQIERCEHHVKNGPLPLCSSYPRSKSPHCVKRCTNPTYRVPFDNDHYRVKEVYSLNGEDEIKKDIFLHGPVAAPFNVFEGFPSYKSGIYHAVSEVFLGGHAVRIIGWGTENGVPYWLAANSWNIYWGDKGLFKILRGQNECQIESQVTAPIPLT